MSKNWMATLSRRLYRSLSSTPKISYNSMPLCTIPTADLSSPNEDSGSDESFLNSNANSLPDSTPQPPSSSSSAEEPTRFDRPLENGLDVGIYKAILVGKVGQIPLQKKLASGTVVTLLSVGTGGIRNNRRPLENEEPREYANRSAVQWHRVSVYQPGLGNLVMKHITPGSTVYIEGNLETKIFTDQITGIVRRVREVAIRRNGRLVFLGNGDGDDWQASTSGMKSVGYY